MNRLISMALRHRVVVVILAAVLVVVGVQTSRGMPFDVFPEFAPTLVEIQTEAPGLSTEEVESLVSVPIENVVNGISFLDTVRSKSVLGLSSVVLIFGEGTDLWQARQVVQERLTTLAGQLPGVASSPVILPPLSATSRVLKIGVTSEKLSQMELTTLAVWTIRPRLMAVPGVANVAIWGQRDRQFQALVDPERLRANDLSLDAVVESLRAALFVGAGGFVDTPNQRLAIVHQQAVESMADLAALPIDYRDGTALALGEVADVVEGFAQPIGDAVINDGPGLLLIVEKQPWGNTFELTRGVEAALEALAPGLTDVEIDSTIFRPATFIEMSLANLRCALVLGCLLVVVVLFAFLDEWRTGLISLLAIPLSLLTAILIINALGWTINTMVLAGLIIALGEVVDDAIIDVENITRRLRLNRSAVEPRSSFRVVLEASLEVRSAVVYGSVIVVLVFMPVFFLTGLSGAFFRPLASAYVLAILASLLVALTVTPALALLMLPAATEKHAESRLVQVLKVRYRRILPAVVAKPKSVIAGMLLAVVVAAGCLPLLGEEFMPKFKEYDFLMHWVEKPGTSLAAMRRITERVSKELRAIPGVRNFGSHIGRAEAADEVVGPNFTELWISLDPEADYETAVAQIREVIAGYPGLFRDVLTYLKERIKEVLTGASGSIVVRIFGPDLEQLYAHSEIVAEEMRQVEGVVDLHIEQQVLVPQLVVRLGPGSAGQFGLTSGHVRRAATTLVQGSKVGEVYEDQMTFDVVVLGQPEVRADLEKLAELGIDTPSGAQVALGDVADIFIAPTPNTIKRESASRRIDVICNVGDRDLGSVAKEIELRVGSLPFAQGYHAEFLGEYVEQRKARNRLLGLAALSILGIFLVLNTDFRSLRLTFLVFTSLPFALIGGVAAVILGGGVISLGSVVGFVTVLGIASRNGIMLMSHYRFLQTEEGCEFGADLALRGAEERLAPILMTALTTMLALLPIVIGGNRPGYEIEHPMALVILGGLVTSTLLNLFLIPALYARFGVAAAGDASSLEL